MRQDVGWSGLGQLGMHAETTRRLRRSMTSRPSWRPSCARACRPLLGGGSLAATAPGRKRTSSATRRGGSRLESTNGRTSPLFSTSRALVGRRVAHGAERDVAVQASAFGQGHVDHGAMRGEGDHLPSTVLPTGRPPRNVMNERGGFTAGGGLVGVASWASGSAPRPEAALGRRFFGDGRLHLGRRLLAAWRSSWRRHLLDGGLLRRRHLLGRGLLGRWPASSAATLLLGPVALVALAWPSSCRLGWMRAPRPRPRRWPSTDRGPPAAAPFRSGRPVAAPRGRGARTCRPAAPSSTILWPPSWPPWPAPPPWREPIPDPPSTGASAVAARLFGPTHRQPGREDPSHAGHGLAPDQPPFVEQPRVLTVELLEGIVGEHHGARPLGDAQDKGIPPADGTGRGRHDLAVEHGLANQSRARTRRCGARTTHPPPR